MFHAPLNRPLYVMRRPGTRSIFNLAKMRSAAAKIGEESPDTQKYTIRKHFRHPQSLMYDLISRVDLYHEFIPYCTASFINERSPTTSEPSVAGLRVGFQAFDEEFTCKLQCTRPEYVKASSISHSLFHFLETSWRIVDIGNDQCEAVLDLKYEFKNDLYNSVSRLFASRVASLMTQAFEKRAAEVSQTTQTK